MSYSFLYFVFWSVIKIDELIFINFVILFILASYCAIRSIIKIDNQIFIYFFIPGPSFLLFSFLPNPSSAPWLPFPPFQVCPASGNKTGCINYRLRLCSPCFVTRSWALPFLRPAPLLIVLAALAPSGM